MLKPVNVFIGKGLYVHLQEEEHKPKSQKKIPEKVLKEVFEPNVQEDDPLSVLTALIGQVPNKCRF